MRRKRGDGGSEREKRERDGRWRRRGMGRWERKR